MADDAASSTDLLRTMDAEATTAAAEEEIVVVVKWNKSLFELTVPVSLTLGHLKEELEELTNVLKIRQKFLGLKLEKSSGKLTLTDDITLQMCQLKKPKMELMMMGTPEAHIFVDPALREALPGVTNDFDYDVPVTDMDVARNEEHMRLLRQTIAEVEVRLINPPRPGKKLLVLDLDYTLFDMKSVSENVAELCRPFLHEFLEIAYEHFDIVVWSQTKWTWLEMKVTEMGMLTHPKYKIMFVLDILSMFKITGRVHGEEREHQVKALEIIWAKFPQYSRNNSIHIDDLGRNFAMNPQCGLKIRPFKKAHINRHRDRELIELSKYLFMIGQLDNFAVLNHSNWKEYIKDNFRA